MDSLERNCFGEISELVLARALISGVTAWNGIVAAGIVVGGLGLSPFGLSFCGLLMGGFCSGSDNRLFLFWNDSDIFARAKTLKLLKSIRINVFEK